MSCMMQPFPWAPRAFQTATMGFSAWSVLSKSSSVPGPSGPVTSFSHNDSLLAPQQSLDLPNSKRLSTSRYQCRDGSHEDVLGGMVLPPQELES